MRAFGAEVVEHGRDFDEAREWVEAVARPGRLALRAQCQRAAAHRRSRHLCCGNLRRPRDVDFVFVPIGGGSGAAGCAIVRDGLGASTRIIGVQARRADAVRPLVAGTGPRHARTRRDVCRGHRHAHDVRPDVLDVEDRPGRRRRARRGRAAARAWRRRSSSPTIWPRVPARRRWQRRVAIAPPRDATVVCVMSGGNADMRTLRHTLA